MIQRQKERIKGNQKKSFRNAKNKTLLEFIMKKKTVEKKKLVTTKKILEKVRNHLRNDIFWKRNFLEILNNDKNPYEINLVKSKLEDRFMSLSFEKQLKEINKAASDISYRKKYLNNDCELHKYGFKYRYYKRKFQINFEDNPPLLDNISLEYIKGLCWVLIYYYQGCPSWSWFFPYHYSPFASDLKKIHTFQIKFQKSKPLFPYGQLMSVLPSASGKALPDSYYKLMKDKDSLLMEFYPNKFKIDLNGKKFSWQAVVLLPFINIKKLNDSIEPLWNTLTLDQKRMNSRGEMSIFVNAIHPVAKKIFDNYTMSQNKSIFESKEKSLRLNVLNGEGIGGFIEYDPTISLPGNYLNSSMSRISDISNFQVIWGTYQLPEYKPHVTKLINGIVSPKTILTQKDFDHIKYDRRFGKPRKKIILKKYQKIQRKKRKVNNCERQQLFRSLGHESILLNSDESVNTVIIFFSIYILSFYYKRNLFNAAF